MAMVSYGIGTIELRGSQVNELAHFFSFGHPLIPWLTSSWTTLSLALLKYKVEDKEQEDRKLGEPGKSLLNSLEERVASPRPNGTTRQSKPSEFVR